VHDFHVFARMNPRQKFSVLALLQERYSVGFLGEGFNDAPGLKMANVGLAVEGASDIAKEAADVILLNRSLSVIFDGIEEGRRTFGNTIKYLKVTLASNFGNFYSVAIASLLVNFLPMLPLQILLLNLLSDFPMITIATDSVDAADLRDPKKYDARQIIIFTTILGIVSSVFDFTTFAFFRMFGEQVLQSLWFMVSVLTELALIYSLRTNGPFYKASRPPAHIAALTGAAAATAVGLPYTPFGHRVFHFISPAPHHLLIAFTIVAAYFVATETVKLWLVRASAKNGNGNHRAVA
jgi:Mg2+-importing ATPase